MTRIALLTLLLLTTGGCATLRSGEEWLNQRFTQSRNLAGAKALLESGDRAGAAKALAAVTETGNIQGTTDEALFLLALIELRPASEQDSNYRSLQLLQRLGKEFPASPWTARSRQLLELLTGNEELIKELRLQARSLKNHNQSLTGEANELHRNVDQLKRQNQSLTNEIHELNRNIDQLKRLDQELEKNRR